MSTDTPIEQAPVKKWKYTPKEKKATNYQKKRGRGYTKTPYTAQWYARRKRKRKLLKRQRGY